MSKKTHRIAVIPGDGIGKEVMPEGLRVLDAAARRFGIDLALTPIASRSPKAHGSPSSAPAGVLRSSPSLRRPESTGTMPSSLHSRRAAWARHTGSQ